MSDWQEILEHDGDEGGLGNDFEARVFAKICRKKRQRRIGIGVTAVAAATLLLILSHPFRPAVRQEPLTAAKKTEVPVNENLFFSTSDSRTRYSLQPVALGSTVATSQVAPDQI